MEEETKVEEKPTSARFTSSCIWFAVFAIWIACLLIAAREVRRSSEASGEFDRADSTLKAHGFNPISMPQNMGWVEQRAFDVGFVYGRKPIILIIWAFGLTPLILFTRKFLRSTSPRSGLPGYQPAREVDRP